MSKHELSQELLDQVRYFIQDTDPVRINRNLRVVLFGYLRSQREGLDIEFDAILNDIEALFNLIEEVAAEISHSKNEPA